uniref:Uncharacterized protein n=1 Tax=Capitella teleta TaxID=283909 RepID=X1ZLH5_CAPTE
MGSKKVRYSWRLLDATLQEAVSLSRVQMFQKSDCFCVKHSLEYRSCQFHCPSRTFCLASAVANNLAAVAKARNMYAVKMEEVCQQYVDSAALTDIHHCTKNTAIEDFNSVIKMRGSKFSKVYEEQLQTYLHGRLRYYIELKVQVWTMQTNGLCIGILL